MTMTLLTKPDLMALIPWQELALSTRATHVLEYHQINTIAELIRYTPTRLCKLRSCGAVSVLEIRQELQKLGLDLKPEPADEG